MPADISEFAVKLDSMVTEILSEFQTEKSPKIKDILERLEENRRQFRENPTGFKTGFDKIDGLTGGFMPRFVWIVGANTNSGKTFFALQLILNALKQKKKCLLFSLEMSDLMNASRLVGNVSGIGALEVFQGFSDERVTKNMEWMSEQPLLIYDNKMGMDVMKNVAKKHHLLGGVDFIIIDYVQNIIEDGSIYENMSKAATVANQMAQETNASVLLVSQLSQAESMRSRKGGIITYKGAGELAAAPDVGLFLERLVDENDDIVKDRMICRIAKNRHGGLGRTFLKFDPTCGFIREDLNQEL